MAMTDTKRNLRVAILVFALAAGFLVWAYSYPPLERTVPVLVGWIGVVLGLLDILAHTDNRVGRAVAAVLSGSAHRETGNGSAIVPSEVTAALWMIAGLALILLVGFLAAVPVYVFAYMTVQGKKPLRQSVLTGAAVTLFIWIVFEVLLEYEIYRGLLFEG